ADPDWQNQAGRVETGPLADIDRNRDKNFTSGNMKMNCWLILGAMIATNAVAQDNTNALPPIPAPSPAVAPAPSGTPAPAVEPAPAPAPVKKKHKAAPLKPIHEPMVTLGP